MPMVPHRRLAVLALAAASVLAACQTAPSAAPSGTAPTASASPATGATPSCPPITPTAAPAGAGAWANDVVYEVFVRSFADSNGDGIGDLRGLTQHLDYLKGLGVTALWLMPVAEAKSYHGYDVTDYTKIEPDYGTADDMRALTAAAHADGLKILVDFVPNHTSSSHPWFLDAQTPGSAHRDWYVWSDTDPGWPSVAGPNPWHPLGGAYYYGAFWEGMPDLDLRNPDVTKALTDAATVWLKDYGVDGFRIDAAKHLIEDDGQHQTNTPETKAWLTAFTAAVHAASPTDLTIGEVWDPRGISASYTKSGALDMTFDFGIGNAILSGVGGDASTLRANQAEVAERYAPGLPGVFLANHDQERILTTLKGNVDDAKIAATLLLTGPGVPFLYYGEELGLVGGKPDENIRRPFPWTAEGPGYGFTTGTPWEAFGDGAATANVATESADPNSLLATYRALLALRASHPALSAAATYTTLDASDPHLVASIRATTTERLLVISNLGDAPVSGFTLSAAATPLCGTPAPGTVVYPAAAVGPATAASVGTDGVVKDWAPLAAIDPHTTVVIKLEP
jgi:alpha-amylase